MVWLSVIGDSVAQDRFQFGEFLVYIPLALLAGHLEEWSPPVYMLAHKRCC